MKVRYIGSDDPTEDRECTVFGLTFQKGEWQDVADVPSPLLTNPMFETDGAPAPELSLFDMKVADLKALAAERGAELGDAVKKADIIAAIELHAEASPPQE